MLCLGLKFGLTTFKIPLCTLDRAMTNPTKDSDEVCKHETKQGVV